MGAARTMIAASLFAFSGFVMLPWSIRLCFGDTHHPLLFPVLALLIGVPMVVFAAYDMAQSVRHNRVARAARDHAEAVMQQTHRCIKPQVLDSLVVFPVHVDRRGPEGSSWLQLGWEAVSVNLADAVKVTGERDTEGPIRRLCGRVANGESYSWPAIPREGAKMRIIRVQGMHRDEKPRPNATFGPDFHVLVFIGGGKAGPTGLAVGVGYEGFGPSLADTVAKRIAEAMASGLATV